MRALRTFLRHGTAVIELEGHRPVVAGRGEGCGIVVDDSLASRDHARFELVGDDVYVVDLESRNGVLVNGAPIEGRRALHHGDIVTVGRTPLVLSRQAREPRAPVSERPGRLRHTSAAELTSQGSVLEILAGGARMSLDDGDLSGAERSARNLQVQVRQLLARGRPVDRGLYEDCLDLLVDVSERAGHADWLDRALELCVQAGDPAPRTFTLRLLEVAARVGSPERCLADYLALEGLDPELAERLAAL